MSRTTTFGQLTVVYAPTSEQIEKALAQGLRGLDGWEIWRCVKCGGPAAGGLRCPKCGAPHEDAYPGSYRNSPYDEE